jgi:hypothetical protein
MMVLKKILKIFSIIISILSLLCIFSVIYFIFSYKSWSKNFEQSIPEGELVQYVDKDVLKDIETKIEEITYSSEDTAILELTPVEVSYLTLNSFQENGLVSLSSVYTQPVEKGRWNLYLKTKIFNKLEMWLELKVRKEERETAEIFFEDILVGGNSLKSFGASNIITKANATLSSALVTAEENGFVGRTLTNIELLLEGLVIKMERY